MGPPFAIRPLEARDLDALLDQIEEIAAEGLGRALLDAAIGWAREAGLHKLVLEVFPHNEAALALYRKAGFEEEGLLRRHYRRRSGELWDLVVIARHLDQEF